MAIERVQNAHSMYFKTIFLCECVVNSVTAIVDIDFFYYLE